MKKLCLTLIIILKPISTKTSISPKSHRHSKSKELTLYLIEKDKKEKDQEAINKKNAQEIDLLKNQLESITKLLNKK